MQVCHSLRELALYDSISITLSVLFNNYFKSLLVITD